MNRLILIGNGFDLAHGMKTSYRDFILHYLRFAFKETMKNGVYGDKLLRTETNHHRQEVANADHDVDGWSLSNFARFVL